jgi:hypothetical protein
MNLIEQSPSEHAPLDHLVVSELEAIIHSERQLQQQYGGLLEAPSPEESQTWAFEVLRLQLRTDRLARMLDALGGYYAVPDAI